MKSSRLITHTVTILLFLIYAFLLYLAFANIDKIASVSGNAPDDVTVVIDAGHGGEDGGAVANGITEKEINLSISNKLSDLLKVSGYNVVMTRSSDTMISTDGDDTKSRKVSDMKHRLEIFNKEENNVVISIHQNKFTQEKYSGAQVFYSTGSPQSAVLAENIRESVTALTQPDNERECKPAGKEIYLLYNAQVPAVIVECGFISNYNEAQLLKDEEYQSKLAFAIFAGFSDYYNNRGNYG